MLRFDKPEYLKWLMPTDVKVDTNRRVCCFELKYDSKDENTLNDWAKHIRRHYISDDELTSELAATGMGINNYLSNCILPDKDKRLGAITISGEFAEILTYDIREYIFGEQVLRGRHTFKATPEQGVTGSDILSYRLISSNSSDANDTLFITESKAVLSKGDYTVLTKAFNDSTNKDSFRASVSLTYLSRLYRAHGDKEKMFAVNRFINKFEKSYQRKFEGSATTSLITYDEKQLTKEYVDNNIQFERAIFIYGKNLMGLAKDLYKRACYV